MKRTEVSYATLGFSRRRKIFDFEAIAYIIACLDFAFVLCASVVGFVAYQYFAFGIFGDPTMYLGIGLITAALFLLAMSSAHAYRHEELMSIRRQALFIIVLIPSVLAFLLTVIFFLKLGQTFSRGAILSLAVIAILGLISMRYAFRYLVPRAISRGLIRTKKALLICPDNLPVDSLQNLSTANGVAITQVARIYENGPPAQDLCSTFLRLASSASVDEVIVAWRDSRIDELERYLAELRKSPLPVKVIFDGFTGAVAACPSEKIAGMAAFQVQRPPLSILERGVKRTFDIVFSALALLFLSPMLLLVALAVKLDSAGPVLFKQHRKGHGGEQFKIVKFRSMRVMEDGAHIKQATKNDPRVTRLGAFIRAYSIDELPQFWNVLRGEMSVVGPRPHAVAHDDIYDDLIGDYAFRRHVKPGLTGWAQINGSRGETPTVESMELRVRHDLWYIDNWSFWLDLKIVLLTMYGGRLRA